MNIKLISLAALMLCASSSFAATATNKKKSSAKKVKTAKSYPIVFSTNEPATFGTLGSDSNVTPAAKQSNEDMVYNFRDDEYKPSFPGGADSLKAFISKHVRYPREAVSSGVQGKVNISFIVEKDGSLSGFKVSYSDDPALNDESMRVAKAMPNWKPATWNGHIVRASAYITVKFTLVDQ